MVLRKVGHRSDCRRVHIAPGHTTDVKEVSKKASFSMHPEIPVGMISQCCIAMRQKRKQGTTTNRGTSSEKETANDKRFD